MEPIEVQLGQLVAEEKLVGRAVAMGFISAHGSLEVTPSALGLKPINFLTDSSVAPLNLMFSPAVQPGLAALTCLFHVKTIGRKIRETRVNHDSNNLGNYAGVQGAALGVGGSHDC